MTGDLALIQRHRQAGDVDAASTTQALVETPGELPHGSTVPGGPSRRRLSALVDRSPRRYYYGVGL
jgi:hypothetical protein